MRLIGPTAPALQIRAASGSGVSPRTRRNLSLLSQTSGFVETLLRLGGLDWSERAVAPPEDPHRDIPYKNKLSE